MSTFNFRGLPLEIRNKVYEHVIAREYVVLWPGYRPDSYEGDNQPSFVEHGGRRDLALLSVAKDIQQEAKRVLYSKAFFSYQVEFSYNAFEPSSPRTEFLCNHIQNIQIDFHMVFAGDSGRRVNNARYLRKLCKALLQNLSGSTILRKMFAVNFTHYTDVCTPLLQTPLFEAFEKLTGFESFVLEINSPSLAVSIGEDTTVKLPWKMCSASLGADIQNTTFAKYDLLLDKIQERLEPSLGPSEPIADSPYVENVHYARYIKFHPRKALMAAMRRRASAMIREAADLVLEVDKLEQMTHAN